MSIREELRSLEQRSSCSDGRARPAGMMGNVNAENFSRALSTVALTASSPRKLAEYAMIALAQP